MTVRELGQRLGFKLVCADGADRTVAGVYCCDLLSVAMANLPENYAWVTVIGNVNAVAVADLANASCIVLAHDRLFDNKALQAAAGKAALFESPLPVYETAVKIGEVL